MRRCKDRTSASLNVPKRSERKALPMATATLRNQRTWPIRRMGLPPVRFKNVSSVQSSRVASVSPVSPSRASKSGRLLRRANLFQGHDQLAIVAAVNAVAHQRAQLQRNRPVVLDGQVGDAAPGIQAVRRDDGLRGAGCRCRRCSCQQWACDGLGRQARPRPHKISPRKNMEPASRLQQQRVLAAPALATARSQLSLQHRRANR